MKTVTVTWLLVTAVAIVLLLLLACDCTSYDCLSFYFVIVLIVEELLHLLRSVPSLT